MIIQSLPQAISQTSTARISPAPLTQKKPKDPEDGYTRAERIQHFVEGARMQSAGYLRSLSGAVAGQLIGMTAGSMAAANLALKLQNLYVLTGAGALMGAAGAIAGYKLLGGELNLEENRPSNLGVDVGLNVAAGLKALPKFVYPTIVGATQAEKAIIYRGLDQLPLSGVTSASTIDVVNGLQDVGAAGLATPLFSQSRIFLDRAEMAYPGWGEQVTIHEIGHTFDFSRGVGPLGSTSMMGGGFGSEPFISGYAETNRMEDFAESYLEYHTHPDRLQRVAPDKFAALQAAQQEGLFDRAMDTPRVREAGKKVGQAMDAVPYSRNLVELAGALLSPIQLYRGARQLEEGTAHNDATKRLQGKLNLASGTLLFFTGFAPLALAVAGAQAGLRSQVAAGKLDPEAADDAADAMLALATGPVGMISAAATQEFAKAGVDLNQPGPGVDSAFPKTGSAFGAAAFTVGGIAAGSLAGSALGSWLNNGSAQDMLAAGTAGAWWGRLAGGALGLGSYGLYQAFKKSEDPFGPSELQLTKEDKIFMAKIAGGAVAGGIGGAVLGGWGLAAAGRALGMSLGGPAAAVTGAAAGRLLGIVGGSYALARAGAAAGRMLTSEQE